MIDPRMIINQMMRNPKIANNPRAQAVLDAWKNKDHDALVNIGNNIFSQSGKTLDQAADEFINKNKFN